MVTRRAERILFIIVILLLVFALWPRAGKAVGPPTVETAWTCEKVAPARTFFGLPFNMYIITDGSHNRLAVFVTASGFGGGPITVVKLDG